MGNLFNVSAIPTLLFFKDGVLLEKNIEIDGEIRVQKGKMVGACGEGLMRLILEKM